MEYLVSILWDIWYSTVKALALDLTVRVGTNKMRETASLIFNELVG